MYLANEDCREGLEVYLRDWNDLVADYGGGEDGCVAIRLANGNTWYVTKGIQFLQEESLIIRDVFENSNGEGFFMLLDGWSDVVLDRHPIEPKLWFSQYELKRANTETNNIQFEEGCFRGLFLANAWSEGWRLIDETKIIPYWPKSQNP